MTEKVFIGAVCDRCRRPYRTTAWPGNVLCGGCDVSKQRVFWRIPESEAS